LKSTETRFRIYNKSAESGFQQFRLVEEH